MADQTVEGRTIRLTASTIGELVDGGFDALRARPLFSIGAAALFLVPVTVSVALLGEGRANPGVVGSGNAVGGFTGLVGYSLATCLLGLPMANAAVAEASGEIVTWRGAFGVGARTWASAVLCWAVVITAKVVATALCVLPLAAVTALTLPLAPVLALERPGPGRALRRTLRLGGRHLGRCLGVVALQGLTALALGAALLVPIALVAGAQAQVARPLAVLLQLAVGLVITPAAATTAALTYLDLRARSEGLDLALEVGRRAAVVGAAPGPR